MFKTILNIVCFFISMVGAVIAARKGETGYVVLYCMYMHWFRDNLKEGNSND